MGEGNDASWHCTGKSQRMCRMSSKSGYMKMLKIIFSDLKADEQTIYRRGSWTLKRKLD